MGNVDHLSSWIEIFHEVNYIHDIISDFSPVEEMYVNIDTPSMQDLIEGMESYIDKEKLEKVFQYFDKILGLYMMG